MMPNIAGQQRGECCFPIGGIYFYFELCQSDHVQVAAAGKFETRYVSSVFGRCFSVYRVTCTSAEVCGHSVFFYWCWFSHFSSLLCGVWFVFQVFYAKLCLCHIDRLLFTVMPCGPYHQGDATKEHHTGRHTLAHSCVLHTVFAFSSLTCSDKSEEQTQRSSFIDTFAGHSMQTRKGLKFINLFCGVLCLMGMIPSRANSRAGQHASSVSLLPF
ncbi:hypothetical protein BaRGS_00025190 [Batillaria attramentaria]|uniref:Uncharacterized protein n=1 Tax=Batillaria attramentaria TaxID=370345 RepID=A0ABD0K996_9CAEN